MRLEDGAGYEEVEEEEEVYKAEQNPVLAEIHGVDRWHRHSMLETEYDLFQGWLVEEGVVLVHGRFVVHLVVWCTAGEYPGPPVCHLRGC